MLTACGALAAHRVKSPSVQLRQALHAVIDFCFPGTCVNCQAQSEGVSPLCAKCSPLLEALESAPACALCAMPLAYADAPCPHCQGEGSKPFERIVALGRFDDPLRAMIHAIKYHKAWPLAEHLAGRLRAQERVKALIERAEVIVPVPLHPWRRLSRGFNQAEVIALKLAPHRRRVVRHPLVRLKPTETQTHFHSRASREANLEDTFALDRAKEIRGRRVLLVDDVMTTGATMRAAARELRKGNPAEISGLVIAIADPRGRQFQRI